MLGKWLWKYIIWSSPAWAACVSFNFQHVQYEFHVAVVALISNHSSEKHSDLNSSYCHGSRHLSAATSISTPFPRKMWLDIFSCLLFHDFLPMEIILTFKSGGEMNTWKIHMPHTVDHERLRNKAAVQVKCRLLCTHFPLKKLKKSATEKYDWRFSFFWETTRQEWI